MTYILAISMDITNEQSDIDQLLICFNQHLKSWNKYQYPNGVWYQKLVNIRPNISSSQDIQVKYWQ